uniref:Uncharacterized protein n=1 Tax=Branchiostoma floridae TaxID=7739 RepID=C3YVV6_BRAFL|eukprot:XP_002599628.1 hypothetical protein BRAFLDRAFT_102574 [Branchiostoma floridae]
MCHECWMGDHTTHCAPPFRLTLQEQSAMTREVCEDGKRLMEKFRQKLAELENLRKHLTVEESTNAHSNAIGETARKKADDDIKIFRKCSNALASSVEASEKSINQSEAIIVYRLRKTLKSLIEQFSQEEEIDVKTCKTAVFTPTQHSLTEITVGKVQEKSKMSKRKRETDEEKPHIYGVCIVATNQGILDTITGEVRRVINQSYPIDPYLVTNKRDIAALPTYSHAICCVSNAPRVISFNDHGELEPDADLGFRAFVKMERFAEPNGVIVILFNHDKSEGSSKLHSMEVIHQPQRLQDLADKSRRFLTVYRQLNEKQQKRMVECIKI